MSRQSSCGEADIVLSPGRCAAIAVVVLVAACVMFLESPLQAAEGTYVKAPRSVFNMWGPALLWELDQDTVATISVCLVGIACLVLVVWSVVSMRSRGSALPCRGAGRQDPPHKRHAAAYSVSCRQKGQGRLL